MPRDQNRTIPAQRAGSILPVHAAAQREGQRGRISRARVPQAEDAARHPPQQQRRQRSKMPQAEAARREHTAAGLVIKAGRIVSVTVCSAPALSEER